MKYDLIAAEKENVPVKSSCRTLKVSRAAYYKDRKKEPSKRESDNLTLTNKIREVFEKFKGRVGSPTIVQHLHRQGIKANHKRVARLMKLAGLKARAAKKFKHTTNSDHPHPPSPNLLKWGEVPAEKNRVWVTDITYIMTYQGWIYLCMFLDLATKKIVGWSVGSRISADLVISAFTKARNLESPEPGLIVHSDRGVQYASKPFRNALGENVRQSMSAKGRCYDNAVAESFFHTLKVEMINGVLFTTREQARLEIFEYIEVYYNRQRLHSSLGYLTPCEMEEKINNKAA